VTVANKPRAGQRRRAPITLNRVIMAAITALVSLATVSIGATSQGTIRLAMLLIAVLALVAFIATVLPWRHRS